MAVSRNFASREDGNDNNYVIAVICLVAAGDLMSDRRLDRATKSELAVVYRFLV